MITCKNCNHDFDGNFCNICGQKAKTARLDWHYLSDEAKYTFLHFNGGLTYSLKQLATRPGHTIREFIEGKRVLHYKPVLMLFVLAGIYGLLMHYIDPAGMFRAFNPEKKMANVVAMQTKIFEFQISHYSLIEILNIPILSIASWLAFRKWKYNFIEHVILNSFAASLRLAFSIAAFPLTYLSLEYPSLLPLQGLIGAIGFGLTIWVYMQFFTGKLSTRILRFVLFLFVLGLEFLIIIITGVVIAIVYYGDQLKPMFKT